MNELSTIDCGPFGPCSGCTFLPDATNPPIWLVIKEYLKISAPLQLGALTGWRTKAKLAIRGTAQNPLIGLFRPGTHEVLPIPNCPAHHPVINPAVEILRQAIQQADIAPYNEQNKQGYLRYVQFFVDLATQKIQLTLVWKSIPPNSQKFLQLLLKHHLWHSIWYNHQPAITNRIFGDTWQLVYGEPFLHQKLQNLSIPFHPAAFSQAHWTLFERLAQTVSDWVPLQSHLVEYYAGIGALGLLAAPHCLSVDLIESNPFAYLSYQTIAAPTHVHYHSSDARDAAHYLSKATCVIVDPPRKGLDAPLLKALKEWDGRLIYVSCDFGSFKRDVDELKSTGWQIKKSEGFLLFPGMDHVEIVALLEKA